MQWRPGRLLKYAGKFKNVGPAIPSAPCSSIIRSGQHDGSPRSSLAQSMTPLPSCAPLLPPHLHSTFLSLSLSLFIFFPLSVILLNYMKVEIMRKKCKSYCYIWQICNTRYNSTLHPTKCHILSFHQICKYYYSEIWYNSISISLIIKIL